MVYLYKVKWKSIDFIEHGCYFNFPKYATMSFSRGGKITRLMNVNLMAVKINYFW